MLKLREKIAPNLEDFFKIVSELGKKENDNLMLRFHRSLYSAKKPELQFSLLSFT